MDKGTLIRTIILALTWGNVWLTQNGYETIPVAGEEQVALGLATLASVQSWFFNNYITHKGKRQKEELKKKGLA